MVDLQATKPELGMGYNFPGNERSEVPSLIQESGNVGIDKIFLSDLKQFGRTIYHGGRFGFKDGSKPKNPRSKNFYKTYGRFSIITFCW